MNATSLVCQECEATNLNSATYCSNCGSKISDLNPQQQTEVLFKTVIGEKNQDYYLRKFIQFERDGKAGISWNWSAFIFTSFWLLYRRMRAYGLMYVMLQFLMLTVFRVMKSDSTDSSYLMPILALQCIYLIAIFVLPGMYANALYYKYCKNQISQVKAKSKNVERQMGELAGKSGTSKFLKYRILFAMIVLGVIIVKVLIPFQEFNRTHTNLVFASAVGKFAGKSVAKYYLENDKMPGNLAESGYSGQREPYMISMELDNATGNIVITMADDSIRGKKLLMVPTIDENKQILWKCTSPDIDESYLPPECKGK